jgi:hypothetical protein
MGRIGLLRQREREEKERKKKYICICGLVNQLKAALLLYEYFLMSRGGVVVKALRC